MNHSLLAEGPRALQQHNKTDHYLVDRAVFQGFHSLHEEEAKVSISSIITLTLHAIWLRPSVHFLSRRTNNEIFIAAHF